MEEAVTDQSLFAPHPDVEADARQLASSLSPSPDLLKQISNAAALAANLELEIQDKEELISELKGRLRRVLNDNLPALMASAQISNFTLSGKGNLPDKRVEVRQHFNANVPAGWPEDQRQRAFEALRSHDGSYLVKTAVTVTFSQGQDDLAREFCAKLDLGNFNFTVKESVHHGQVSTWLKNRVQKGQPIPPLDVIGATMGNVAVIKDVDRI